MTLKSFAKDPGIHMNNNTLKIKLKTILWQVLTAYSVTHIISNILVAYIHTCTQTHTHKHAHRFFLFSQGALNSP